MPPPFFKCYPSDFLNGVADLSPNALAVYTVCMMRMYDEDGPILDDPVRIARRCNMRLPTCKKALNELDSDGKIVRENGCITNARVHTEIVKRHEMRAKQSRNARGTDLAESQVEHEGPINGNEYNEHAEPTLSQTPAKREPTRVRSQRLEVRKKKEEDAPAKEKKVVKRKPKTPYPDNWQPDERGREYARKHWTKAGRPDLDIAHQVEQFRNYHLKEGKLMASWSACWRTWVGNAPGFTPRLQQSNGGGSGGKNRSASEQMSDSIERVAARRAKSRGEQTGGWGAEEEGRENFAEGDGPIVELFPTGQGQFGE